MPPGGAIDPRSKPEFRDNIDVVAGIGERLGVGAGSTRCIA